MNFEKIKTIIISLLVVAILCVAKCANDKQNDLKSLESFTSSQKDSLHHYMSLTGDTVTYKANANVDQNEFDKIVNENASLKVKLKNYKNVQSVTSIASSFQIDTTQPIIITFHDTIPVIREFKAINFNLDSTYYNIGGTITTSGLTINKLKIPNEQTIIVGEKRNGLFKKNEYVVSVQNSNKFVVTTGLENITVKQKSKGSFWIGYVLGAGSIIGLNKLTK